MTERRLNSVRLGLAVAAMVSCRALGTDILHSQSAALDQPRINAYLSLAPGGAPQIDSLFGSDSFNIQAYYDTGASGVLLSNNTADALGIAHSVYNGQEVLYSDVGVAGSDNFNVSNPISISLAPFHPDADIDNINTYGGVYNQHFNAVRTQIGPAGVDPDPTIGDLDVFGMPTMAGKVVVMDPRPVNSLLDTMRTYVYNPGTPYNAAAEHTNPGIPTVDRHIKLSYVSFDRFTQTTPAGASPPTLHTNPFIGPNPFTPADTTPKVTVAYGGSSTQGSFLLDTGAAASIVSKHIASNLGVTYQNNGDPNNPVLMYNGAPIDEQFSLTIGGIGGSTKVAGFYLSSLLVKTEEGVAANNNDLNLNFLDAPVLVTDISVANPNNASDVYTLDGIFGMNFLVASARVEGTDASGFPIISQISRGNFDWLSFDEPAGKLGVKFASPTPQNELSWSGNILTGGSTANRWDFENVAWVGPNILDVYTDGDYVTFGPDALYDSVRLTEVVAPGGVTFDNDYDYNSGEGINYDLIGTGHVTGFTGLTKRGTGELHIYTANDYTGSTSVEAGTLFFHASQNIGSLSVGAGGEVRLIGGLRQQFKSISVEGKLYSTGGNIVTRTVAVTPTGLFDLATSKMVIEHEAYSESEAKNLRGVLLGSATTHGLTSSAITDTRHALGYIESSVKFATFPATWNGEALNGDEILVQLTLKGDANLTGNVNFDDLLIFAQNYRKTNAFWWQGDFDYNGTVNFDDLLSLAQNYGGVALTDLPTGLEASFAADWAVALSLVPEPASMGALAMATFALPRRRMVR